MLKKLFEVKILKEKEQISVNPLSVKLLEHIVSTKGAICGIKEIETEEEGDISNDFW